MDAIDVRDRKPRNLVVSGDSLISGALSLTNTGFSATLPDTATTRTHTLSANCRAFALRLDVTALVAVGPVGTPLGTSALGPGNYTIVCGAGSIVVARRHSGSDATSHIHIAELN